MVRFERFFNYKTANHIASCNAVRCGTLLLVVQYSYAILRAVLVCFLLFVWFLLFDEHP